MASSILEAVVFSLTVLSERDCDFVLRRKSRWQRSHFQLCGSNFVDAADSPTCSMAARMCEHQRLCNSGSRVRLCVVSF